MKVLMLGWEFPPHISGGLGTACHGLTTGLAAHGVRVKFVIPRATGDESAQHVELVGGNQIPIERTIRRARTRTSATGAAGAAATALAEPTGGAGGGETTATAPATADPAGAAPQLARLLELLAIDSPLAPYQRERDYAAALAQSATPGGISAHDVVAALQALLAGRVEDPLLRELRRRLAPDAGSAPAPEPGTETGLAHDYLEFTGRYGNDLLAEVGRYALAVGQLAQRGGFDVVHAHDWMTFPAGLVAARIARRPLVIHVHATEYDRSGEHVNEQVRAIEQLGIDHADRIVCVSHFTASLLRRRYGAEPQKVRVVHNAVTHAEQAGAWGVHKAIPEPIVLFLGRVTFQKGPDYFLEAAARVVALEPHVKFVMSGSGDMLPRMIEHAARLGLARHVHFTGFLRGKDVERMYAMADIYVMPSVSEPFGISPLEAMALDVPCIVSRQSGVAEVLRNALKFDFWDVEDLANKILALLRRPPLAQQLREEGRGEVARMRWEESARLVERVYEELCR